MTRAFSVRRSLALTTALALTTLGGVALPAQALDPGNGNGKGHSKHDTKSDKSDKGQHKGQGDKAKGGQSDDAKDKGQGPKDKGNQGQGPKDKGDKSDQGQGPKDKGDKGGGKGDPAGNNGTVKITPIGEDDGKPQNTPHVTCGFDIEWYGFDEGDDIVSTVVFAMQAPTSDVGLSGTDPAEVFVGGDPATGAGTETGFDGEATYRLVFDGEPHPQQGYHVKLTIHTPGSKGADTKHKVFWVEPCEDTVTGGTTDETEGGTEGDTDGDMSTVTDEADEDTEVAGVQASTDEAAGDTEVMGAQASAPAAGNAAGQDVPSAVDAGEEGNPVVAFVTSPLPLLVLGLGLALAAAALISRRRAGSN